ncbi:hypothetical protein AD940_14375 [Gluconobacter thailandicus]|nr:hypothetical protein AD940_14375 [Gluconobacter thailandicus]
MSPTFTEMGFPLPPFRVSVGFTSGGMKSAAIGECWNKSVSEDGKFEIFIGPGNADSMKVAAILAHELIHAAAGLTCGHKGDFAKIAIQLGFDKPLTHIGNVPANLASWIAPFIEKVGEMPHARLRYSVAIDPAFPTPKRKPGGMDLPSDDEEPASNRPKKQDARLIKATCPMCGYTVRVTRKWLEIGPPHCPEHGAMETT